MKITKRNVVSVIAQLFDPLGLLSPIFIIAKLLLQKIHKSDGEYWDTVVIRSLTGDWNRWLLMLKSIEKVEIPRFYFHGVKFRRKDELNSKRDLKQFVRNRVNKIEERVEVSN